MLMILSVPFVLFFGDECYYIHVNSQLNELMIARNIVCFDQCFCPFKIMCETVFMCRKVEEKILIRNFCL